MNNLFLYSCFPYKLFLIYKWSIYNWFGISIIKLMEEFLIIISKTYCINRKKQASIQTKTLLSIVLHIPDCQIKQFRQRILSRKNRTGFHHLFPVNIFLKKLIMPLLLGIRGFWINLDMSSSSPATRAFLLIVRNSIISNIINNSLFIILQNMYQIKDFILILYNI